MQKISNVVNILYIYLISLSKLVYKENIFRQINHLCSIVDIDRYWTLFFRIVVYYLKLSEFYINFILV